MHRDGLDYQYLIRESLREVVRRALELVALQGLPGDHHFYITFRTDADGVEVPPSLLDAYPEEMTIIIQHQFWDLEVEEEDFSVVLAFSGRRQRVIVPYSAITSFLDPSVQFVLQFEVPPEEEQESSTEEEEPGAEALPNETRESNVVSMEAFRRGQPRDD